MSDKPDESGRIERAEQLARKVMRMRLNAIALRGSVLNLTQQRDWLRKCRDDLINNITRHETAHVQSNQGDREIARSRRGLKFLNEVLMPETEARINRAHDEAGAFGGPAEKLLAEAASELEFIGVRNAL